ncbi:hypothetical protein O6H91_10G043300 [Diphasiastrum complanatum]|uniref:Uncharacterized protein n=1 Tax=Diphasiastrum complanatum TaxID=34168 RepID=A0ACC2CGB7_DIPCM|nr:hypothetical protein O6H91_10G043300 [Diphasiastrum complanatum]
MLRLIAPSFARWVMLRLIAPCSLLVVGSATHHTPYTSFARCWLFEALVGGSCYASLLLARCSLLAVGSATHHTCREQ